MSCSVPHNTLPHTTIARTALSRLARWFSCWRHGAARSRSPAPGACLRSCARSTQTRLTFASGCPCWNVLVRAAIKHSPLLNSVLLSTQSSSQLSPPLSLFIHTRVPCSLSCTFTTTTVSYPSLSCLVLQSVNVQPCLLFNRFWASTPALERIASTGNHPKCNCSSQQSRHH